MKIVNSEELIEILKATTAEEITLTTSTEVKMNKRGNSLVENGNKVTKTTCASYQFGSSYEERINESFDSSLGGYKAKPLPWGAWVEGAEGKVITHIKTDKEGNETTNFYLRYYNPTSEVSSTTFVDGEVATDEQMKIIEQFTPKKKSKVVTENGVEVENKVKTNVVNFANIVTIEIDGEVYKVED